MKLLNVHTRETKEFWSDADAEPYAILSHTWDEGEVSFEDLTCLSKAALKAKRGYSKIDKCCLQAEADGYHWVWIDTCCIDKRSSAELSEAINSMFRYYERAAVCYAYFADVRIHAPVDEIQQLRGARWFTRGWTLQELLAPREMVLFAHDWTRMGTRCEYQDTLSRITRIETAYLCGTVPLSEASISKRMSWAAQRTTSRLEDTAYCLLGIFDVNMPLLYGEGKKAFRRLQEEIMKANPSDHTLMAWGRFVPHQTGRVVEPLQLQGLEPIPWDFNQACESLRGLFADSPADFWDSHDLRPWRGTEAFYSSSTRGQSVPVVYPTITGAGVELELPVLSSTEQWAFHWSRPKLTQLRHPKFALLLCETRWSVGPVVLLPLYPWGHGRYGRRNELIEFPNPHDLASYLSMRARLQVEPRRHRNPQRGEFLVRHWGDMRFYEHSRCTYRTDIIVIMEEGIVIAPSPIDATGSVGDGLWAAYIRLTRTDSKFGFGIIFSRVKAPPQPPHRGPGHPPPPAFGPVAVSFVPLLLNEPMTEASIVSKGFTWYHRSNPAAFKPILRRTMVYPEDVWQLKMVPFPVVDVCVRRIGVGPQQGDIIDLVDITLSEREY
ncbi:heterokaryon incompatibility protein-domain-containing protein [Staphylotrichum tortipilum]|uniref:Heterokaryon incompatibility protein-domain-containing protein n=1 Tax=Staphylotrichum tortipilum TaxID=2831512 RepID=A0AAN6MRH9_9PEZI|nr:heterokaryon incompatibility protein-domain-containing protein [Staphylotrichum longicolle]